jgi:hypothetical protein
VITLLLVYALAQLAPVPAVDVRNLSPTGPRVLFTVDADTFQGDPDRLSWSPDGSEIYLRFSKADRWANLKSTHYLVKVADGRLTTLTAEPDWAVRYWLLKSALAAPGGPDFRVVVDTREERKTPTGIVGAGAMAQSSGDPSAGSELGPQGPAIVANAQQAQRVSTTTMRLKGELVGEFVNQQAIPGLLWGWAREGAGLAAITPSQRKLLLIDRSGHKRPVPGVGAPSLPAWSPDDARLACLDRQGKKRIALVVFDVSSSR